MALKSGGAGVLVGRVFWRWGLPFSYLCHARADATHLLLAPALL